MLWANENYLKQLRENIADIKENIWNCERCHGITDAGQTLCSICKNPHRNHSQICLVEEYLDLLTLEGSGSYDGVYHVLWGAISPMNGVFVGDLNFSSLFERIQNATEKLELIIASNPNLEGEATASFCIEEIAARKLRHKVTVTRLSRGLSSGYIEYADTLSLVSAIKERKEV
jgi:recombination protein RecR